MKLRTILLLVVLTTVVLTGCQSSPNVPATDLPLADVLPADVSSPSAPTDEVAPQSVGPDGQTQVDEQGAVTVSVTPLNLSNHDETLDFEIAMNTHSVDLGMDLSALATLQTDTGLVVPALSWEASTSGGHHVSGQLHFPANPDGRHLLDGANTLTLNIQNVDAPERVFTWQLAQ